MPILELKLPGLKLKRRLWLRHACHGLACYGLTACLPLLLGWLPVAPSRLAGLQPWAQATDGIDQPIANPGDPVRGRLIALDRESTCILCHQIQSDRTGGALSPGGNLAPPLTGVGARLSTAQIRLRLVDSSRVNPNSIMPAYFKSEGLRQVASNYTGRTILQPQQIEDLVAWLATLK